MRVEELGNKKLTLTNDGELSVFFVGAGSAFTKAMKQTNILIIKGKDHLMVDCGTKTPQALWNYGLSVSQLDHFFITHSHADHIGGLEEVMLMNRYMMNQKRPNIYITGYFKRLLWNHSLRGGVAGNETHEGQKLRFNDLWKPIVPKKLKLTERATWSFEVGKIKIDFFRTMHTPNTAISWKDSTWSSGIIIDEKILFTSDTRFDPQLLDHSMKNYQIDTIFHDCQFFDGGVHASINQLDTLRNDIKEKIVLMHYGDNWSDYEERVNKSSFIALAKEGHFYRF